MKKTRDIRILAIIPARGGSKSIPHKNILPVLGKPLVVHAIEAALQSARVDAVIVSTDDEATATLAREAGADVPFLRPAEISGDTSRDIEYLQHALDWLERDRGWRPEIVVMLQPTSPGRTGKDIDAVIDLMERENADSVRTMIDPGHYNPFKMWVEISAGHLVPLLSITKYKKLGADVPRQALPRYFVPFGLVYATRAKFIRRGKVWGPNLKAFMVPKERMVDIDSVEDLQEAEEKLRAAIKKNI